MRNTIFIFTVVVGFYLNGFSQMAGVFKDYTHIIIPTKFMVQDDENQFQLNSLVRQLFKQDGFTVYMDKELKPAEFDASPCDGLLVDLDKRFNIIQTTIVLTIFDCRNNVVFSAEGTSKEKGFKKAYQEGIREAFKEVERANFTLTASDQQDAIVKTENKNLNKEERIEMRKTVVKEQSDLFQLNGEEFYFFPVDDMIHLYASNAYDIVAKLTPITETKFIFNSDEKDGIISLQDNGNFELEYREPSSKETKKVHYYLLKRGQQ